MSLSPSAPEVYASCQKCACASNRFALSQDSAANSIDYLLTYLANSDSLAGVTKDAFYLIGSLCCNVLSTIDAWKKYFLFVISLSVSRANTAHRDTAALWVTLIWI